jgi:hypothetical protein
MRITHGDEGRDENRVPLFIFRLSPVRKPAFFTAFNLLEEIRPAITNVGNHSLFVSYFSYL